MEKAWYKEKMKEQIIEGYKVIGRNIKKCEKISKIMNSEERYRGKKKIKEQEDEIHNGMFSLRELLDTLEMERFH